MIAMIAMRFAFLATFFLTALAENFLGRVDLDKVPEQMKQELLAEIEKILGQDHRNGTEQRIGPIEEMLRPIFNALPKNSNGKLDHSGVRYSMHRLFVQRHRWVLGGADKGGEESAAASQAMVQDKIPEVVQIVQALFEQRTAASGSNLHDVALLAATLEHLVQSEMRKKLEAVYQTRGLRLDSPLTVAQVEDLVDLYMMSFVRGLDLETLTQEQVAWLEQHIHKLYPPWENAAKFWHNIVHDHVDALHKQELFFDDITGALAQVGDSFAEWQDSQCHVMKDMLLEMEDRGSGRVKLIEFYKAAIYEGKYQFTETINYLRQIGTLDETDPLTPRVIIPNYVSGLSNCIARTSYYSICCLDECEGLFGHIEKAIGMPDASPLEIAMLVERLPSATVEANRTLSSSLLHKLDELGQHHGGRIPLHGRLFAQWMHLAYPRECIYPHMSGTTYKKTMEQWERETGERSGSTIEEIVLWTDRLSENDKLRTSQQDTVEHDDESFMWTMDEELLVSPGAAASKAKSSEEKGPWRTMATLVIFAAAIASVLFGMGNNFLAKMTGIERKKDVNKFNV